MNQEKNIEQVVERSLVDILVSLKNHIVLIILVVALFTGLFWGISKFLIAPTYDSTVMFYIEASFVGNNNPSAELQAFNLAQKSSNTYIELMKTNSFYDLLANETGKDLTVEDLEEMIRYKSVQDTEIFEASVRTPSPDLSLEIARTIAEVTPNAMNKIKSNATLTVIDQPLRAKEQSTPNVLRNTALGFVFGLFAGSSLAILMDRFNIKIKTEDDITKSFDITVIGIVPKIR